MLSHMASITSILEGFWKIRPHNAFFHAVDTFFTQCHEFGSSPTMTQSHVLSITWVRCYFYNSEKQVRFHTIYLNDAAWSIRWTLHNSLAVPVSFKAFFKPSASGELVSR